VGRLKSRKSESFGLLETVALEHELFMEVAEAGELLIVLVIAVEVCNDAPVVKGDGFGTEVFVGPLAASLNGMEEPGGGRGDGERGVTRGGEDLLDVLLFFRTQFASDASSFGIIECVERAYVGGGQFEVVMDGNEELGDATVVQDEARGDVVVADGLEIMLLYEACDLVLKIMDLDAVSLVAGIDGTDETHNDGS